MKMVKDVVCNMGVDEKNAKFSSEYKGRKYYFCSDSCKRSFDANPVKFVRD
jgi:YHS domain-containing protein